jgi:hypothetical protein
MRPELHGRSSRQGQTYPSVEQDLIALGFDGAFAGTYLE